MILSLDRWCPSRVFTLLLLAVFGLAGCMGSPHVVVDRAVWVSIGDSKADIGDEASVLNIDMTLSNPNDQPIELREVQYRVSHQGREVYTGRRATHMTLLPGVTSQLALPVVIRGGREPAHTGQLNITGTMEYVETGRLALVMRDLGMPRPTAGFSGSAQIE